MENEFEEVMSKRTDEELIKIVTIQKDDYNPDAVKAAELEIEKRKIDIQNFEKIKEKLTVDKKQIEKVDTNVVNSGIRFLNFLIDFIVIMVLALIIGFIIGLFVHPTDQELIQIIGYILILGTFRVTPFERVLPSRLFIKSSLSSLILNFSATLLRVSPSRAV